MGIIMEEKIGKVTLNYKYYSGSDLYSDGDEMENKILDIVKTEKGYEYFHPDYHQWAVMYHLTRQRENIVEPMELSKDHEVLEIGAGMGAITGARAARCRQVDCIELSKRRSMVNAYRHQDMDNIQIMVGNFQDIQIEKKYDVITLIGVLEYAYHYLDSETPYEDFVKKMASCLKPGGKLYVAIENKLGLKYFAGYHEDHLGKPYVGLEGYKKSDKVRTFTRSELQDLLEQNGFSDARFFYPFPDYKLPTVIYSEEMIESADIEFAEDSNYDMEVAHNFNMNKVFAGLKGTKERKIFANSFLVEAVKR